MLSDTKARSLVKGISWRTIGSIDTFVIAYFFFGKVSVALPIALTEVATKITCVKATLFRTFAVC
jgi:uncharacterized membrane protein